MFDFIDDVARVLQNLQQRVRCGRLRDPQLRRRGNDKIILTAHQDQAAVRTGADNITNRNFGSNQRRSADPGVQNRDSAGPLANMPYVARRMRARRQYSATNI